MARPRKIIALQTGNINKADRERRKYEEELTKLNRDELETVPTALFLDSTAKKEYKRILKNLKDIDIIGNLDRDNLIVYANAYSIYVKACKEIKKKDFKPIVITKMGERPNPVYTIMEQAKRQMDSAGNALGMSASSRLKLASEKAKGQEEELRQMFGDI